jgi:hypothetical protein
MRLASIVLPESGYGLIQIPKEVVVVDEATSPSFRFRQDGTHSFVHYDEAKWGWRKGIRRAL